MFYSVYFCESHKVDIQYDVLQEKMERSNLMQSCSYHNIFDKLYFYNTSRGRIVREAVADYFLEKSDSWKN